MPYPHYTGFVHRTFSPASDPQNLGVIRQEKTLALAKALQACVDASGAKTGILRRAVKELQQCMALLMTHNGNDAVEAFLLRPVEEELDPPLPKRRLPSLAKNMGSWECQALLPDKQKSPGS